MFIAKLSRKYRKLPRVPCPCPQHPRLIHSIPCYWQCYHSGTFIAISGPTLTPCHHLSPWFIYIRVHSWWCIFYEFWQIYNIHVQIPFGVKRRTRYGTQPLASDFWVKFTVTCKILIKWRHSCGDGAERLRMMEKVLRGRRMKKDWFALQFWYFHFPSKRLEVGGWTYVEALKLHTSHASLLHLVLPWS